MKKIISLIISSILVIAMTVSAAAADLSGVMPDKNAGGTGENFCFDNPLLNWSMPDGEMVIDFDLAITGQINPYATIFCFHNGDGNGRVVFTMAGAFFYNDWAGHWFDGGLHNSVYDNLLGAYEGQTVHIRIYMNDDELKVSANDELLYDYEKIKSENNSSGAFYGEGHPEDVMTIYSYICMREFLDFGYCSWWVGEGLDDTNAEISDFTITFDGREVCKYFVGGEAGNNVFHDESEYATETEPAETKAPETEPAETEAPETKAPETKAPDTEAPTEEKKGCGSAMGVAAVIVTVTSVFGCALVKKH